MDSKGLQIISYYLNFLYIVSLPIGKRLHERGDESCVGDTKNLQIKSRRRENLLHGGKGGDSAARVCGQSKVSIVVCLGVVEVHRVR